jgi:hypothetical protein
VRVRAYGNHAAAEYRVDTVQAYKSIERLQNNSLEYAGMLGLFEINYAYVKKEQRRYSQTRETAPQEK